MQLNEFYSTKTRSFPEPNRVVLVLNPKQTVKSVINVPDLPHTVVTLWFGSGKHYGLGENNNVNYPHL